MEEDLIIALCIIGFATVLLCPYVINRILKFKLEIEKIRSETEIRKEEIRARNQMEIERMLSENPKGLGDKRQTDTKNRFDEYYEEPVMKQSGKEKLKY